MKYRARARENKYNHKRYPICPLKNSRKDVCAEAFHFNGTGNEEVETVAFTEPQVLGVCWMPGKVRDVAWSYADEAFGIFLLSIFACYTSCMDFSVPNNELVLVRR